MRRDVTRAQIFSAVAEAFMSELESRMVTVASSLQPFADSSDDEGDTTPTTTTTTTTSQMAGALDRRGKPDVLRVFLDQIDTCGFLVQFESLLSTHGKERTMIGDYEDAIQMVHYIKLRLVVNNGESYPSVKLTRAPNSSDDNLGYEECAWIMEVACPVSIFSIAPSRLKCGGLIDVTGVLFTQGINEQQTMANFLGESALQDIINRQSYPLLQSYFQKYSEWVRSNAKLAESQDIDRLSKNLEVIEAMSNKRSLRTSKNTELLPCVADFCRAINGGRCTSCKSGKDRTAMSVTWEEARILNEHHGLPEAAKAGAMHAMRDAGVRRFNVIKNTGECWYAFNPFQHQMLPEVYRAPRSSRSMLLMNNVQT